MKVKSNTSHTKILVNDDQFRQISKDSKVEVDRVAKLLEIEKKGNVGIITLNNPPLNVLSRDMLNEIEEAFVLLEKDRDTVSIILTGKGEKTFIAGADIKNFPEMIGNKNVKQIAMESHKIFSRIDSITKPTIAVLNGLTLGGGLELALTCDLRIAESHTKLGLPEVKLGILPGWGGTQRLPRLIGESKAKEMMFTGEVITADDAEKIGLVNHTVSTGEGLEFALELANKISMNSLTALSRIKQSVDEGLELSIEEGLEQEAQLFSELFLTEDVKEGIQAFLEKRKPLFKHK